MESTTFSNYNSKIITSIPNLRKSSHDSFISNRVCIIMIRRRLIFDWFLFFQSQPIRKAKKNSKIVIHTRIRPYSTTTDSIYSNSNNKFDKYEEPSSIILKHSLDSTPVNYLYYYYQMHFNYFEYRSGNLWVPCLF